MSDDMNDAPVEVFDATPYLKLVIDKDGRWFQNGSEITHREIYLQFNQMLERTPAGGYQVKMGREVCQVEVEDAPFVVRRVKDDGGLDITVELNDGTREAFKPEKFWIGRDNVPYMNVKGGVFHARFSRPAYYQIAEHIVSDDAGQTFHFALNGRRYAVNRDEEGDWKGRATEQ